MKIGDIVKITDGFYSVRLDKYEERRTSIGLCKDDFEVIYVESHDFIRVDDLPVHDIHIKNLRTNAIYLHSARFAEKVGEVKRCKHCGERIEEC